MKPWLLNVLACPMCKHYPLDAYFFKWETPEEDMRIIVEQSGTPSTLLLDRYRHTVGQILDETITLEPIQRIRDLTENSFSQVLLEEAVDALGKLIRVKEKGTSEREVLARFGGEVDTLYRYLNLVEVEEGLLVCGRCSRWYPIGSSVAAVPEMLPDNLRERGKDLDFLRKWEGKVPREVLERGRPFNLRSQP